MKMPASFAEFSDALQKARIKDGSFCKNELTCIHYNGLTHAMIGWNANLYDLNLFAQRLASLTEEQKKGMDALLKIKQNHRVAPIPLNQLINLTYNTDICCFAPRVSNHEELGAFLYANEMLSNEAMALLDTTEEGSGFQERLLELLGEQHQEDHGGVFTDFGYAELGGEIKDIYVCQSNETACFHRSDAPVVLEVRKGFFNDPSYDNDKTAVLNLPAADAGIWRAVEKVDAASVDECAFRCVDCLIPFLRDAINNASRLLGIDSIDEYIRYGGTLRAGELAFDDEDVNAQDASFRDNESTRRYIDTAICKNIQHSLACYESGGHFRHLYSLYEAGELTSAINRIIEDMNHRFLISVLTDDFLSHDLRLTAANLRKERDPEKRTEALDAIDTEAVTQRLMELLDIRNKEEQSIGITTAHIIEIKQYLTALELIVDCPIESADPGIEPVEHILFTQPGMRYCQAQALVHSLLKDEQFSALSEYDKTQITGRILEEVRGRMMEDIVLLETMKAADKDHRVFKLQFEAGEFDMVIYDQKENSCEIFEIKHSSKQVPFQYRHLVDEDKCQRTERRFGPIHGRYILYRGEDAQMENGVQYWNVENYLKALPTLDIVQVQEIGMQSIEPTL